MSDLKKAFENTNSHSNPYQAGEKELRKITNNILSVTIEQRKGGSIWSRETHEYEYRYDFSLRMMTLNYHFTPSIDDRENASSTSQCSVVGFSQLDEDVLEILHQKLIELGGNPPPLSDRQMNKPMFQRGNKK